jgi:hypothetical protein
VNSERRFRIGLFAVLWMLSLAGLGSFALASEGGKIGLSLQRALDSFAKGRELTQVPGAFNLDGKPQLKIFVEATDFRTNLTALGVKFGRFSGNLATAVVPLEAIPRLASLPQIVRLEAGSPVLPDLDVSVPDIGADEVWDNPDWGTDRGEGVLVGMVDSGISLTHENFRDAQGRSRIQYVWDLSQGTECSHASIEQGTCGEVDTTGHGTGVMGTLAGNGQADCGQAAPCSGVAPEAGILAVKMAEDSTSADVAEAVDTLFAKADELGMPIVVNLSLSWFSGPRDGSSLDEQFISGLVREGHIVVAAAGNQGLMLGHAEANLTTRKTAEALFTLLATPPLNGDLEGWYNWSANDTAAGRKIEVQVSCRSGFKVLPVSDWLEFGEGPLTFTEPLCGSVTLNHNGETDRARGFDAHIENGSVPTHWLFEFKGTNFGTGNRNVDLWINPLGLPTPAVNQAPQFHFDETVHLNPFTGRTESYRKTITPPSTADNVLCVSSYNTRCPDGYCKGILGFGLREGLYTFSAFSSRGPRRDDVLKPDVAGPGQAVIVPGVPNPESYVTYATGTTISAPHLAGTVALMLHLDPLLSAQEIRSALPATVRKWQDSPVTPWRDDLRGYRGYGMLDAFALVDALFSLPEPPANLLAELVGTKQIQLTWDPSASQNVTRYRVYWNSGGGEIDYGTPVADVAAPVTTWTSEKLHGGKTYSFGVRALNEFGEEQNTSVTASMLIPAPAAPQNLQAQVVDSKQVRLTWDPSTSLDVVSYRVYWNGGSGVVNYSSPLQVLDPSATSWTSPVLGPGTYAFSVTAADGDEDQDIESAQTASATIFATLGTGDDDFCFIASAAYASSIAPQVNRLREVRDRILLKTAWGREFVKAYYRLSPPVADWLRQHEWASALVRLVLSPFVGWSEAAFHRGPFWSAGLPLAVLLAFGFVGSCVLTRRVHQS